MKVRGGFIYLDVLMAVVILAGAGLLLREFYGYECAVLNNSSRTAAAYLAQAEMEKLKAGYTLPRQFSQTLNGKEFTLDSYAETSHLGTALQKITVDISWQEFTDEQTYQLVLWKER